MALSINQAQKLIEEMKKERKWLEYFTDNSVNESCEVNVEDPPERIMRWMAEQHSKLSDDISALEMLIDEALNTERIIDFESDGGDTAFYLPRNTF